MRMDRHHLLEIILWPNGDGTFRKIINTKKRLRELGIYDDWKLTITIPADEHSRMHCYNRSDETKRKMSKAKISEKNPMYGKKHSAESKEKISKALIGHIVSDATKAKISEAHIGEKNPMYGKKLSDEHIAKMTASRLGAHWYNNGIRSVFAKECPTGFVPGRIYKRKEA